VCPTGLTIPEYLVVRGYLNQHRGVLAKSIIASLAEWICIQLFSLTTVNAALQGVAMGQKGQLALEVATTY